MPLTNATRGQLARRVWYAAAVGWAAIGASVIALVFVRDATNGCNEPHNQPSALGGMLALAALAFGLLVVAVTMVSAVSAKRGGRSLQGFWAAYLGVSLETLAAAALFAVYLRDTFTFCF